MLAARTCRGSGRRTGLTPGVPSRRLRRGVNGEAPEVAGNPAAVKLFGNSGSGAGAAETVQYKVPFVRRRLDYTTQECFRLLGIVANSFGRPRKHIGNFPVQPHRLNRHPRHLVQITLERGTPFSVKKIRPLRHMLIDLFLRESPSAEPEGVAAAFPWKRLAGPGPAVSDVTLTRKKTHHPIPCTDSRSSHSRQSTFRIADSKSIGLTGVKKDRLMD